MIRFLTILFLLSASCFAQVKQWHLTNTSANVQLQLDNRVMRVATLAALKALPAAQVASGALVLTAGYTTAGDGGGGAYVWTNSIPPNSVTNRGSLFAGASGFWMMLDDGEKFNVKRWGAKGDAKASNVSIYVQGNDDTEFIQEAIDHCVISGGGTVKIPSGFYRVTSPILIQRTDDVFSRLGLVNQDTNSVFWDGRTRLKIEGDSIGTSIVCQTENGVISVSGKSTYNAYGNRIQNVVLEDLNIHHMGSSTNTYCISIYNAGYIAFNRVRTRGSFISLKLSALSETQINKCDFLNSSYGVWMERGNAVGNAGDMAGVTILDCQVMNQTSACVAAHYFRDIHVIGGFIGSYSPTVATIWLSGLAPTSNDSFWLDQVGIESDPFGSSPAILIGANGTEGVYNQNIYPLNTWTNSQSSLRGLNVDNCYLGYSSHQGAIRIRGSATEMTKGLAVSGCRFDTASTQNIVVIESGVPGSVVARYGQGNTPVDLITRTRDERGFFLTTTVEANVGNLINKGWSDMSRGGNNWFGSITPTTTITNLASPFGVDLAGGSFQATSVPIWSGASPVTIGSNDVVHLDYAVLWNTTNSSAISTAVQLLNQQTGAYYTPGTLGQITEYASYTNQWGTWRRYVCCIRNPTVQFDRVAFVNTADTNTTVTLGYLAIYSSTYSGDGSSLTPSGASIWSGFYEQGHNQWIQNPTSGNWFARKWTAGWAVRGNFSSSATYSRGTSVISGTNVYLASQTINSGGSTPTHTSGIVNGWAFVASGNAASEERVVTRTAISVSLPATTVTSMSGDSPSISTLTVSGGSITLIGGEKKRYSHIWNATGSANLVFSSIVDGDTGTLLVRGASTNVTLTLSDSFAYTSSGSSITIPGGLDKWSLIQWRNFTNSGTNCLLVDINNHAR